MKSNEIEDLKKNLMVAIKKIESLLNRNCQIKNIDLIDVCRKSEIELISTANETHLIHEILETGINQSIIKNFDQEQLTETNLQFQTLNRIASLMEKCPTQTWRGEEQIKLQQYSTPPTIAFLMAKILKPSSKDLILEPSAGTGSLAVWLKIADCNIHINELSPTRRILLELQGYKATGVNAEFLDELLPEEIIPDGVLMNPPFSANAGRTKSADSNFGFRHVKSALTRLREGGKLVALLGRDALTRSDKGLRFLNEIQETYDLKAVINLPQKAYYKYGTSLPTSIICIKKSNPTKLLNKGVSWKDILNINCKNLEEVLHYTNLFD